MPKKPKNKTVSNTSKQYLSNKLGNKTDTEVDDLKAAALTASKLGGAPEVNMNDLHGSTPLPNNNVGGNPSLQTPTDTSGELSPDDLQSIFGAIPNNAQIKITQQGVGKNGNPIQIEAKFQNNSESNGTGVKTVPDPSQTFGKGNVTAEQFAKNLFPNGNHEQHIEPLAKIYNSKADGKNGFGNYMIDTANTGRATVLGEYLAGQEGYNMDYINSFEGSVSGNVMEGIRDQTRKNEVDKGIKGMLKDVDDKYRDRLQTDLIDKKKDINGIIDKLKNRKTLTDEEKKTFKDAKSLFQEAQTSFDEAKNKYYSEDKNKSIFTGTEGTNAFKGKVHTNSTYKKLNEMKGILDFDIDENGNVSGSVGSYESSFAKKQDTIDNLKEAQSYQDYEDAKKSFSGDEFKYLEETKDAFYGNKDAEKLYQLKKNGVDIGADGEEILKGYAYSKNSGYELNNDVVTNLGLAANNTANNFNISQPNLEYVGNTKGLGLEMGSNGFGFSQSTLDLMNTEEKKKYAKQIAEGNIGAEDLSELGNTLGTRYRENDVASYVNRRIRKDKFDNGEINFQDFKKKYGDVPLDEVEDKWREFTGQDPLPKKNTVDRNTVGRTEIDLEGAVANAQKRAEDDRQARYNSMTEEEFLQMKSDLVQPREKAPSVSKNDPVVEASANAPREIGIDLEQARTNAINGIASENKIGGSGDFQEFLSSNPNMTLEEAKDAYVKFTNSGASDKDRAFIENSLENANRKTSVPGEQLSMFQVPKTEEEYLQQMASQRVDDPNSATVPNSQLRDENEVLQQMADNVTSKEQQTVASAAAEQVIAPEVVDDTINNATQGATQGTAQNNSTNTSKSSKANYNKYTPDKDDISYEEIKKVAEERFNSINKDFENVGDNKAGLSRKEILMRSGIENEKTAEKIAGAKSFSDLDEYAIGSLYFGDSSKISDSELQLGNLSKTDLENIAKNNGLKIDANMSLEDQRKVFGEHIGMGRNGIGAGMEINKRKLDISDPEVARKLINDLSGNSESRASAIADLFEMSGNKAGFRDGNVTSGDIIEAAKKGDVKKFVQEGRAKSMYETISQTIENVMAQHGDTFSKDDKDAMAKMKNLKNKYSTKEFSQEQLDEVGGWIDKGLEATKKASEVSGPIGSSTSKVTGKFGKYGKMLNGKTAMLGLGIAAVTGAGIMASNASEERERKRQEMNQLLAAQAASIRSGY